MGRTCKNILILTASGRINSNSSALADAFANKAKERGHNVTIVNTIDLNIKPCFGCGQCYDNGTACIFNDDFEKIAPQIIAADVLVFAFPVYWYSIPAQMKLVIDKFITFTWGRIPMRGKQCALLTCAEETNKKYVFEDVSGTYDKIVSFMNWNSIGKVMQEGVYNIGEIKGTKAIKAAEQIVTSYL